MLIAGRPGSGLSALAATWPDPYYLLFGGDLTWIDADLAYARVTSIDELMTALTALNAPDDERAAALGVRVGTVVIDTVDGLEHLVGDDPRKMRRLLIAITALPLHVVLLCHVRSQGERLEPAVCIPDEIPTYVDLAMYLGNRALPASRRTLLLERYVRVWTTPEVPWVTDRTGHLGAELVVDDAHFPRLTAALELDTAPAATPTPARAAAKAPAQPAQPPAQPPDQPVQAAQAPVVQPPPPPPPPEPEDEPDDDEDGNDLPMCESQGAQGNDCLGRVESQDSLDLSQVRFSRPMCGPCGKAEYEAMPKVLPPRKAKAAAPKAAPMPAAAAARPSAPLPESGALPHGEVVGRIPPSEDKALRDLLDT